MAHVNRNDYIERFFSKTKSRTVEQMLEELPEGQYETNIVHKGLPSETAFKSAENSLQNSSNICSYNVTVPDYPSELNPELKPFRNPIRNSIEIGLSSEGRLFIPQNHPITDYDEGEYEKAIQGPGISEDLLF